MKKSKKIISFKMKGFSLIELMTVVVVVVVLSAISGPIYNTYSIKAKQAEGYALLGTILSAQQNYHNDSGVFLLAQNSSAGQYYGRTDYDEVLGIDARNNNWYRNFCIGHGAGAKDMAKIGYFFHAIVSGNGVSELHLMHNRTTGTTIY